ncbi:MULTISPECIES: ParA family protein [Lysinibacillus]|uniref:ParA family protein n=1 Tax=Lysinibacillus TaxID=400634 RepID=UPI0021A4815D|nr:ParA family protein [Lysinibacillus capsici]MCT1539486.1 ParA family protein [Lysinibacillus capsici]MCT1570447.1 ParA family protein [Lysinibacillus capsici]MCT1647645.1 ParA family protein [Lysinibacillus capsici]MCT1726076.1 ParA family protein [Lysinibacillus capsici]MCT1783181.1 ParA family protein [Lysinibacillus capsici]
MKQGKVVSFLNMKGGVGKTTLCKDLAFYYANNLGKDILVVDIDPQSNCTQSFYEKYPTKAFDRDAEGNQTLKANIPSIHNLYDSSVVFPNESDVILELTDNLHIIPGDLKTLFMERNNNSTNEQKLAFVINKWKLKERYDFIFIDCPPTYSFYTTAALLGSDYYFIPSKPDLYSVLGLNMLTNVVDKFVEVDQALALNGRVIKCVGIVVTMSSESPGMYKRIEDIREFAQSKGIHIFEKTIPYYEKLLTGKMDTFIADRDDIKLEEIISSIATEFIERVEILNEQ